MQLILTRHGETEENKKGIVQGHMQGTLSSEGQSQAKALALRLKDEKIDAIYSSDLKRAADTAKEIAAYHHAAELIFTEGLREGNAGSWTGVHKSKIDWNHRPSDAETILQMQERAKKMIDSAYLKHSKGLVVFVVHNGIAKALISVLMNKKFENVKSLNNTSVSIFEIKENGDHKIKLLNCTNHLLSEQLTEPISERYAKRKIKYPTREEAMGFYKELNVPENIIMHVLSVNKVANFLAENLKAKGEKIDLKLVDLASLLHDLDKWICLNDKKIMHGYETERILSQKGYPELGFYAKQHIIEIQDKPYKTWEEKIIAYADKRCLGGQIVSLKERYDYINEKYPPMDNEKRERTIEYTYEMEKEIFDKIGIRPEELRRFV